MAPPPEPDLRRGVFETLLVHDGEPVGLTAHLARLAASLDALYDLPLPASAAAQARRAAAGLRLGRLRLDAVPAEGELRLGAKAEEVDAGIVFPTRGMSLRSHPLPGGLGTHKLIDRPPVGRATHGPGPLLVDGEEALETGWGNLFAVKQGLLRTPPLDGRILPGTSRAAVLAIAAEEGIEAEEQPLSRGDLLGAEEVFLTGSIRGLEAAVELDGEPLRGSGPLSRLLAAALRSRWGLPAHRDDAPAPAAAPTPGRSAR
ncbi:MAG TPA: aminotransferase class IV [Solirubrobacterales bacterium]|nr:aminotransferase class IV [Solirubrobacterales bacterium]